MAKQKTYIAIDLKSFYASVECKERNRDPLTTNLVVADKSRTCLLYTSFEQFSRALLTKMGVEFTNKGVQVSNDGGIDGYGYQMCIRDRVQPEQLGIMMSLLLKLLLL